MKNSKFFNLFKTLQKKEILAFRKYLKTHHGGEKIPLKVFEYAAARYPKFRDKKLELAYAYQQIFESPLPESESKRKKILNVLSDLHLWLKDFLISGKLLGNSFESRMVWLGILYERQGLRTEFARESRLLYKETIGKPKKDIQDYTYDLVAGYFYYRQLSRETSTAKFQVFQEFLDTTGPSVEALHLKLAAEMKTLEKVRPKEKTEKKPDGAIASEPKKKHEEPLLLIYREILQLVQTGYDASYYRLKSMLYQFQKNIDPAELHAIFRYLYNHAASKSRGKNQANFTRELQQLNIFGSEYGFFSIDDSISTTQFTNIVNVACSQKDFDWAQKFIRDHTRFLPEDSREDITALSEAMIAFQLEKYEEVLRLLKKTEFKDIHFLIRSKTMVLRSCFELDRDINAILDYCANFKAQLNRTRKPHTPAVVATLEFVRVLKLLVTEEKYNESVIRTIEDNPNLYFREWLLDKANALKTTVRHSPTEQVNGVLGA